MQIKSGPAAAVAFFLFCAAFSLPRIHAQDASPTPAPAPASEVEKALQEAGRAIENTRRPQASPSPAASPTPSSEASTSVGTALQEAEQAIQNARQLSPTPSYESIPGEQPPANTEPSPTPSPSPAATLREQVIDSAQQQMQQDTEILSGQDLPSPSASTKLQQKVNESSQKQISSDKATQSSATDSSSDILSPQDYPTLSLDQLLDDVPKITPDQSKAADLKSLEAQAAQFQADFAKAIAAFEKDSKAPPLTIDKAIEIALRCNPDILNAVEQIRNLSGQYIQVRSQALPRITVNSAYEQQSNSLANPSGSQGSNAVLRAPDGTVLATLESDGNLVQDKTWNVTFQGSQILWDGGAVIGGIRAARFAETAAYYTLRQVIDTVIADVKTAFYQVILNRGLVVAQEQSVQLLESQLKDQQNRYEAGTVPRFNVLQAEVALANAKPGLISARNNLRISQYQLVKLLGMNYGQTKPSELPFTVVGNLDFTVRNVNIDASIDVALARSPFLKAQRHNILSQAANVMVALSGYQPKINATAGYGWQSDRFADTLSSTIEGWFFGVQGSWAIFDGFETYGRVKQAKAQLESSKINYDNSVRQVILDVQEAVSNLQDARETLESQRLSVTQAAEALRLAQERLDAGAGTQLDVLNAQVELLTSQSTELSARYNYIAALAQYDRALSLDTQYEEYFDDPLTRPEQKRFKKYNDPDLKQPKLPRSMQKDDPLPPQNVKGYRIVQPSPTPEPKQTPSKRSRN